MIYSTTPVQCYSRISQFCRSPQVVQSEGDIRLVLVIHGVYLHYLRL